MTTDSTPADSIDHMPKDWIIAPRDWHDWIESEDAIEDEDDCGLIDGDEMIKGEG